MIKLCIVNSSARPLAAIYRTTGGRLFPRAAIDSVQPPDFGWIDSF